MTDDQSPRRYDDLLASSSCSSLSSSHLTLYHAVPPTPAVFDCFTMVRHCRAEEKEEMREEKRPPSPSPLLPLDLSQPQPEAQHPLITALHKSLPLSAVKDQMHTLTADDSQYIVSHLQSVIATLTSSSSPSPVSSSSPPAVSPSLLPAEATVLPSTSPPDLLVVLLVFVILGIAAIRSHSPDLPSLRLSARPVPSQLRPSRLPRRTASHRLSRHAELLAGHR